VKAGVILIWVLFSQISWAQSFGRFGFRDYWKLPSMEVTKSGITSSFPGSTSLQYDQPSKSWQGKLTSTYGQTVLLNGPGQCPTRIVANLFHPSISVEFSHGFSLTMNHTTSPFLTWKDGSVTSRVPTPLLNWVLVSFDTDDPPILILLPHGVTRSFKIVGSEGKWRIVVEQPFQSWLRIAYPQGDQPIRTKTAASLGELVNRFEQASSYWLAPIPRMLKQVITGDDNGVTVDWTFSSIPMLPPPLILAPSGGYALTLLTKFKFLTTKIGSEPLAFSNSPEIKAKFPIQKIPAGRFLASGLIKDFNASQNNQDQIAYTVTAGLKLLCSSVSNTAQGQAEDENQNYLLNQHWSKENWTGDSVPYSLSGAGMGLASAQAFLSECLATDAQAHNQLFASLAWSMDWFNWLPSSVPPSPDSTIRSAGIAAVTGAFSTSLENRLHAAMFEAGIAAQKTNQSASSPGLLEPLAQYRSAIFNEKIGGGQISQLPSLFATSKILSGQRSWGTSSTNGLNIHWIQQQGGLQKLITSFPEVSKILDTSNLGFCRINPLAKLFELDFQIVRQGPCYIRIKTPPHQVLFAPDSLPPYQEFRWKPTPAKVTVQNPH